MACDAETLVRDARCLCIDEGLYQQVMVSLLCKILQILDPMATCDAETLIRDARCLCIPEGLLPAVLVSLLCKIYEAAGGGLVGGSGVTCGNGPPTTAPSSGCGVYLDSQTWQWYGYDPITAAWYLKLN
jgi:hypothetical protein